MPGLDGTGPCGEGPLTGRKRGRCAKRNQRRGEDQNPDLNGSGVRLRRRKHGKGETGNEDNKYRRRRGN